MCIKNCKNGGEVGGRRPSPGLSQGERDRVAPRWRFGLVGQAGSLPHSRLLTADCLLLPGHFVRQFFAFEGRRRGHGWLGCAAEIFAGGDGGEAGGGPRDVVSREFKT